MDKLNRTQGSGTHLPYNRITRSDSKPGKRGKKRIGKPPLGSVDDVSFEDMAQITLDAIGDAVLVIDPDSRVIYLNKVAERLTGWPSEQAIGRPVADVFSIFDGTTRVRAICPGERAMRDGETVGLALGSVLIRRDGTDMAIEDSAAPIYNRHGKVAGAVVVFHDARRSEVAMEELSHLSQHDTLTDLPNRVLLKERLNQSIGIANRLGNMMAVMFLDLDNFKSINDTYGHAIGDQLLRDVAADMSACVRSTDTVSRHGGDEFIILLTLIHSPADAVQLAQKILERFAQPRVVSGHRIQVSLSIGISIFPDDGQDPNTLIHCADRAMYVVKDQGRNSYRLFQSALGSASAPSDAE